MTPPDDQALRDVLTAALGRPVVRLDRVPSDWGSSFRLEELAVDLGPPDRPLKLVFKDVSPAALLPAARGAKPDFLLDPRREIGVYRHLLRNPADPGSPPCRAAVVDPGAGRHWLFLDHVEGTRLTLVGEFAAWRQAAGWVARLHDVVRPDAAVPLLVHDAAHLHRWADRAVAFCPGADADPTRRPTVQRIADGYDRVVDALAAMPSALLHGDCYPTNLLVRPDGSTCGVDWELAGVGPPLLDVAALTAGRWTADQRRDLLRAYAEASAWAADLDPAELHRQLQWCRLYVAVQWLGWSADWRPPPAEANDWFTLATGLAAALGVI